MAPSKRISTLKLRLYAGDEIAMGPGKADLLEAIQETGSITNAGKALGMSYRRTWMLVDTMNRCYRLPLVITVKGGAQGGGAKVTELGAQVLAAYRKLQVKTATAGCKELDFLESKLARIGPKK